MVGMQTLRHCSVTRQQKGTADGSCQSQLEEYHRDWGTKDQEKSTKIDTLEPDWIPPQVTIRLEGSTCLEGWARSFHTPLTLLAYRWLVMWFYASVEICVAKETWIWLETTLLKICMAEGCGCTIDRVLQEKVEVPSGLLASETEIARRRDITDAINGNVPKNGEKSLASVVNTLQRETGGGAALNS